MKFISFDDKSFLVTANTTTAMLIKHWPDQLKPRMRSVCSKPAVENLFVQGPVLSEKRIQFELKRKRHIGWGSVLHSTTEAQNSFFTTQCSSDPPGTDPRPLLWIWHK